MMAPFFKYGLFGDEMSLVVAFVIGLAFGFVLERAGFGKAPVLAAQFYFRDLRVLKVMFTAIVTAMVGLFLLSWLGFVDLSLVYLTPTFLLPQIVGGLILGAGFIIGGYCPGTSCVSAATGRIDGIAFLAGMVGGLVGFAELYPRIAGFAKSTALGRLTLPQLLHVPYGLLVLAVVLMAFAAFIAAEWAERKIGGKAPDADGLLANTRAFTPVRRFAAGLVGLGLVAALAGNPYRGPVARIDTKQLALDAGNQANRVTATQLADWLIEGRNDFVLVDLRDAAAYAAYHLPTAVNIPLAALGSDVAARNERLIVYGRDGAQSAEGWLLLRAAGFAAAYVVAGGIDEWNDNVLFPVAPAGGPAKTEIDFARRAAVAKHFGGAPRAARAGSVAPAAPAAPVIAAPPAPPPPVNSPAIAPTPPRRKKEGC